jgi:hypothetical protein
LRKRPQILPGVLYLDATSSLRHLFLDAHISARHFNTAALLMLAAISLTSCSQSSADSTQAQGTSRSMLSSLRTKADPNVVAHIIEEEKKQAQSQSQATIYAETAGAQQSQSALGRNLPNVSTDPFSRFLMAPPADSVSANGSVLASNNAGAQSSYHQGAQLATYESAYSSVPAPPPGALGAGLVPPPPAVTLSTQAQTVAESAAAFYNNPYFNPFGVPAPPQANAPARRPAGLFGGGGSAQYGNANIEQKHKADFVPITPKGMESRSPYKQRDDLRILWKGTLKSSANLGELAENTKLIEQLNRSDIGLPGESSKGSFNVSARQVESFFKAASIDKRAFAEVRRLQTDLVQAYYRYLSTYNKYALVEQTVAARKQEIDLSESDAEKQRATADLAQSQNDLDAAKDDLRSAEIELAVASNASAARTLISRVAGIAPSIESLAQGVAQSGNRSPVHTRRITGLFDSVFKHPHTETAPPSDLTENPDLANKPIAKKNENKKTDTKTDKDNKLSLFGRSKHSDKGETDSVASKDKSSHPDDLEESPTPASKPVAVIPEHHREHVASPPSSVSFQLKNVTVNPRKSILSVVIKNSGSEPFELNPDAIYIAEGNRKLGAAALRADFDITSIEPDQEVKGTITILSRPWNDKLVIYLVDGKKTIQLKR